MTGLTLFNTFTGIGVIAIIIVILGVYALLFLGETNSKLYKFIKHHSFLFALILATGGVFGSLMYSEVFHFAPCLFCWWQRIFLYPQAIILAVALWFRDTRIWLTSIILSSIGGLFSIYHILLQTGIIGPGGTCETVGVSCTKIDVLIFGWITIPIMCLVLFVGILTFAYVAHRK